MRTNTHNALHIKCKIRPKDYRQDENVVIRNPKTGVSHTFPVDLVLALQSGLIELKSNELPFLMKKQAN